MVYFLYARKSTDVEDKQVRSIDDQLAVLRALAKGEGVKIAAEFVEKRSAKTPGRPVFNEMLERVEKGGARSILCWKLDRLARNPIDAARVQWLLQQGTLAHIRTNDRSYYPSDNVLMIGFEFGIANQYIRDLSANTKRGLHEKAKRGEYPTSAPIGYVNDKGRKTVIVDRGEAKIVKAAFELYAEGNSRLEDISAFFFKNGIHTKGGKPLFRSRISVILSNPFYYGHFRYAGDIYEGKHEPIMSKALWDKVQTVLKKRGWQDRKENDPRAFCGLLKCGECGCSITAEIKVKHQKNGNVHRYVYYHCTKKRGVCSQPCTREEALSAQASEIIGQYAMPTDWASELSKLADKDEREVVQSSSLANQAMREELDTISQKLQRLFTLYFRDEDIDRDTYRREKELLLSRKKSLEEERSLLHKGHVAWLEPLREWLKDAEMLGETAVSPDLRIKKSSLQKIFGSNPSLKNRRIEFNPLPPYAALRAARQNFSENQTSSVFVRDGRIELPTQVWKTRVLPLN